MTPIIDAEQLKKQNAMLLRALTRVKAERDVLAQQIAALQARTNIANEAEAR